MFFFLFHSDDKVAADAPEVLRVGDAENIHSLSVFLKRIGACRVVRHQFCALGVEFDDFGDAEVDSGEVVFVEVIVLQHVVAVEDSLLAQFLFSAEDVVGSVHLLVLCGDAARLFFVLFVEVADGLVEGVDFLGLFSDANVFFGEFGSQRFYLFAFFLQLFVEVCDHFFQFRFAACVALAGGSQLLLETGDEFFVECQSSLDELHVFHDGLTVRRVSLCFLDVDSALRLVDLVKSFLDLRERFNQVA